jgi:ethanolamine utilization protein EutN
MQQGFVVGTAISSVRHRSMAGFKLLVVQPLLADGRSPDGDPVLAIDTLGSGTGEVVMITSDGRTIREMTGDRTTPIRWSVIGIPD